MAADSPQGAHSSRSRQARPTARGHRESGRFPVVGIGASAGGLAACRTLLGALDANSGMAFIVVQHLDPAHESMMASLLASHTTMTVVQAEDGAAISQNHVYVIPPGFHLSVTGGTLRLSRPQAGARLPFDVFLRSLAEDCGPRAACVVLSGTGADGSEGLKAVKEKGGMVIAQDPAEAAYDGMPKSAIATGAVDLVLPAAEIPGAVAAGMRGMDPRRAEPAAHPQAAGPDWLTGIVDLLRARTGHDFRQYKLGTVQRRIERRMAIAAVAEDNRGHYLDVLRQDPGELGILVRDLLINVTGFFRDPQVFGYLEEQTIPDLVRSHPPDRPIRIWIAGCSTGEEAYSLAMLFLERIAAAESNIRLQVFASDADAEAVAAARDGIYPQTAVGDVSPERLARFFSREDRGYRVRPELRGAVVFTVHDVLADPPFSRLDMVSCRNLLIYFRPDAQASVLQILHFALRPGGILLLGASETVGGAGDRFEAVSKAARVFRHIGRSQPWEPGAAGIQSTGLPLQVKPGSARPSREDPDPAGLCQRLVVETYSPAAVLINHKNECLYTMGPAARYFRFVPGSPTRDLFAMVRQDLRGTLMSAVQRARLRNARITVPGCQADGGETAPFSIDVSPVAGAYGGMMLVCFVEETGRAAKKGRAVRAKDAGRVAELERDLDAARNELDGAVRSLEISAEEQKAIKEEAMSVNEEYQSTNEELMTSKEELQSVNEELTVLNSQLQETLERQRTLYNDLQNVLYSTDVATIFLDTGLNIRFFTPATRLLFSIIPGDVGRPLADLSPMASDISLLPDAMAVLHSAAPIEREIEARNGSWYSRRILPYRTQDNEIDGVVITFEDITGRRRTADALAAAVRQAELASVAKSRFLAAASHDLRQPLQTLALLQGLLMKSADPETSHKLGARIGETTGSMTGMLDALLDINQIEAGTIRPDVVSFPIGDILGRLGDEFTYHAQAQGLALRTVPCSLLVRSDPRLLEQMVRNLLSNALKFTPHGKVLLGCRRRGEILGIEVWDTGTGIPAGELQAIFEEYHQLGNATREQSRGLGLGLSIVQRLASLLGHRVHARSRAGKGSVFAIEVPVSLDGAVHGRAGHGNGGTATETGRRSGLILVVEDDPELRGLLGAALGAEGHQAETAHDSVSALGLVAKGAVRPDLILADYNLPNGMNGLELASMVREKFNRRIPVIVLTGDISTPVLRDIAAHDCVQINKPVKLGELAAAIQELLPQLASPSRAPVTGTAGADGDNGPPVIFVVDDDAHVRELIRGVLEADGWTVADFASCEEFLEAYSPDREACLLVDAYLPGGMDGFGLLQRLRDDGHRLPSIMITGRSDVITAVQAMKAGASDFIEKPVARDELLASIRRALEQPRDSVRQSAYRKAAASRIAKLTTRQRQIMDLILEGHPNKNIAADLGLSQRSVENHRAAVMRKTGAKSLPALARLALAAAPDNGGGFPPDG